ncbi:MAG: glutathione S-transferase family protein [Paludibacterium sp.]|uniref:glutathione S-transferase family protein n=1 Tax=Paludibacterium sp. TaxID=1917523 RepID=UPI0025D36154|nr:glutathione S-transferase family protein [Paludibacterium sp.]MBV8047328.1 glutathione S-transferase family protein [Paludibacterium sp.]
MTHAAHETIVVYGPSTSINVRKVLFLLALLGTPFQHFDRYIPEHFGQRPFEALNPNRLYPLLRCGDFTLWESNSILRYLAGRFDPTLHPDNEQRRALVDQWLDWQAADLNPAWRYAYQALVKKHPDYGDPAAIARSQSQWDRLTALLADHLTANGPYAAGDFFSIADIALLLSINRWRHTKRITAEDSPFAAYLAAARDLPGYRRYVDNGQP